MTALQRLGLTCAMAKCGQAANLCACAWLDIAPEGVTEQESIERMPHPVATAYRAAREAERRIAVVLDDAAESDN